MITRKEQRLLLMSFLSAGSLSSWLNTKGRHAQQWRKQLAQGVIDNGVDTIDQLTFEQRDKLLSDCVKHHAADPCTTIRPDHKTMLADITVSDPDTPTAPMTIHQKQVESMAGLGKRLPT